MRLLSHFLTVVPFLPITLTQPLLPSPSIATVALQQVLARYPLAIDGKNFSALSAVFTPDVVANYSAPLNIIYGLKSLETVLEESLAKVSTQHALSTFSVQSLDLNKGSARTVRISFWDVRS